MRLSRTDLVPVLAIVAGGVIGASLSFSLLGRSADDDVQRVVPVRYEYAVTLESVTRDADRAGTVTGRVIDALTGVSLRTAQVFIGDLRQGSLSQRNGRYLIQNVPAGTHTLSVERIGYRTVETQITIGGGQTVEQNFAVSAEALRLGAIVVGEGSDGTRRTAINLRGFSSIALDNLDRTPRRAVEGRSEPIFMPMTVLPEIRNLSEVHEALMSEYPPLLRNFGIGGTVVVWFFISEEGTVLDSRVRQPSPHTQLNEAALKVAEVFRFTPALNRNERVQLWIQLPIVFEAAAVAVDILALRLRSPH